MMLQKGTRVVVRVPVPAAHGVLPAGSVAEIVALPVDPVHAYRVRFLNGHEASVQRNEFELLSEVKSKDLHSKGEEATSDSLRKRIIYKCVVGSRAYGLETESSDTDWRGIYQAPTDLVLSLYDPPPQLENDEAQECYWELKKFLTLALKANPNVLEVLHSSKIEIATPIAEELLEMRAAFLSKLVYQTFGGYILSQFKKMLRSKDLKRAPNWKHAMHLLRLLESGTTILKTGEMDLITKHREALLEIKRGEWPWARVDDWRQALHKEFEQAYLSTPLPDRPNYERVNRFLIRARHEAIRSVP